MGPIFGIKGFNRFLELRMGAEGAALKLSTTRNEQKLHNPADIVGHNVFR